MTINIRSETRRQRINKLIPTAKTIPVSFVCPNLNTADNYSLILRTAVGLGFEKAYVIGSEGPDIRAKSAYSSDLIPIVRFSTPSEFLEHIRNSNTFLIAIEKTEDSKPIDKLVRRWYSTTKVCVSLGNESFGTPAEIIHKADEVIHLPIIGPIPCFNVACAASIAFYRIFQEYQE